MVTIKNFEIAQLFGLTYEGYIEEPDRWGDIQNYYVFQFGDSAIMVLHGWGDDDAVDEDEAKEEAAKRVLLAIGKMVKL